MAPAASPHENHMAPAATPHENPKAVCVMDASGHLGMRLVERLLQRGYSVHAAVQNHGDLQLFKQLLCENNNLHVFQADPFDYQSIMDALRGCLGLFYTFEPPKYQSSYDEYMADVEVRAAHNVLEACAQTETVEKVVFTSSITAVTWKEDRNQTPEFDERNWSDANFCRNFKLWHALSKTLAERTAWALAMDRGLSMVSINGGLMTGPDLSITNPYLKGAAEMYEDGVLVAVDIDFLVDAHVCVFEDGSTYGRYLCFNHVINRPEDAVKLAQMLTPHAPCPPSPGDSRIFQQRISNKKLNKLMIAFSRGAQMEE